MFSSVVVKNVSSCGVYCVSCTARHTIHTTPHHTQIVQKFLAFYGTNRFLLPWSKAPTDDP